MDHHGFYPDISSSFSSIISQQEHSNSQQNSFPDSNLTTINNIKYQQQTNLTPNLPSQININNLNNNFVFADDGLFDSSTATSSSTCAANNLGDPSQKNNNNIFNYVRKMEPSGTGTGGDSITYNINNINTNIVNNINNSTNISNGTTDYFNNPYPINKNGESIINFSNTNINSSMSSNSNPVNPTSSYYYQGSSQVQNTFDTTQQSSNSSQQASQSQSSSSFSDPNISKNMGGSGTTYHPHHQSSNNVITQNPAYIPNSLTPLNADLSTGFSEYSDPVAKPIINSFETKNPIKYPPAPGGSRGVYYNPAQPFAPLPHHIQPNYPAAAAPPVQSNIVPPIVNKVNQNFENYQHMARNILPPPPHHFTSHPYSHHQLNENSPMSSCSRIPSYTNPGIQPYPHIPPNPHAAFMYSNGYHNGNMSMPNYHRSISHQSPNSTGYPIMKNYARSNSHGPIPAEASSYSLQSSSYPPVQKPADFDPNSPYPYNYEDNHLSSCAKVPNPSPTSRSKPSETYNSNHYGESYAMQYPHHPRNINYQQQPMPKALNPGLAYPHSYDYPTYHGVNHSCSVIKTNEYATKNKAAPYPSPSKINPAHSTKQFKTYDHFEQPSPQSKQVDKGRYTIDLEEQIMGSRIPKIRDNGYGYGMNPYLYEPNKFHPYYPYPPRHSVHLDSKGPNAGNLREFLSSWNEIDDDEETSQNHHPQLSISLLDKNGLLANECSITREFNPMFSQRMHDSVIVTNNVAVNGNLPDVVADTEKQKSLHESAVSSDLNNSEKLYVLESIEVPASELNKYKHLNVIHKLPENVVPISVENSLKFIEEIESNREKYYKNDLDTEILFDAQDEHQRPNNQNAKNDKVKNSEKTNMKSNDCKNIPNDKEDIPVRKYSVRKRLQKEISEKSLPIRKKAIKMKIEKMPKDHRKLRITKKYRKYALNPRPSSTAKSLKSICVDFLNTSEYRNYARQCFSIKQNSSKKEFLKDIKKKFNFDNTKKSVIQLNNNKTNCSIRINSLREICNKVIVDHSIDSMEYEDEFNYPPYSVPENEEDNEDEGDDEVFEDPKSPGKQPEVEKSEEKMREEEVKPETPIKIDSPEEVQEEEDPIIIPEEDPIESPVSISTIEDFEEKISKVNEASRNLEKIESRKIEIILVPSPDIKKCKFEDREDSPQSSPSKSSVKSNGSSSNSQSDSGSESDSSSTESSSESGESSESESSSESNSDSSDSESEAEEESETQPKEKIQQLFLGSVGTTVKSECDSTIETKIEENSPKIVIHDVEVIESAKFQEVMPLRELCKMKLAESGVNVVEPANEPLPLREICENFIYNNRQYFIIEDFPSVPKLQDLCKNVLSETNIFINIDDPDNVCIINNLNEDLLNGTDFPEIPDDPVYVLEGSSGSIAELFSSNEHLDLLDKIQSSEILQKMQTATTLDFEDELFKAIDEMHRDPNACINNNSNDVSNKNINIDSVDFFDDEKELAEQAAALMSYATDDINVQYEEVVPVNDITYKNEKIYQTLRFKYLTRINYKFDFMFVKRIMKKYLCYQRYIRYENTILLKKNLKFIKRKPKKNFLKQLKQCDNLTEIINSENQIYRTTTCSSYNNKSDVNNKIEDNVSSSENSSNSNDSNHESTKNESQLLAKELEFDNRQINKEILLEKIKETEDDLKEIEVKIEVKTEDIIKQIEHQSEIKEPNMKMEELERKIKDTEVKIEELNGKIKEQNMKAEEAENRKAEEKLEKPEENAIKIEENNLKTEIKVRETRMSKTEEPKEIFRESSSEIKKDAKIVREVKRKERKSSIENRTPSKPSVPEKPVEKSLENPIKKPTEKSTLTLAEKQIQLIEKQKQECQRKFEMFRLQYEEQQKKAEEEAKLSESASPKSAPFDERILNEEPKWPRVPEVMIKEKPKILEPRQLEVMEKQQRDLRKKTENFRAKQEIPVHNVRSSRKSIDEPKIIERKFESRACRISTRRNSLRIQEARNIKEHELKREQKEKKSPPEPQIRQSARIMRRRDSLKTFEPQRFFEPEKTNYDRPVKRRDSFVKEIPDSPAKRVMSRRMSLIPSDYSSKIDSPKMTSPSLKITSPKFQVSDSKSSDTSPRVHFKDSKGKEVDSRKVPTPKEPEPRRIMKRRDSLPMREIKDFKKRSYSRDSRNRSYKPYSNHRDQSPKRQYRDSKKRQEIIHEHLRTQRKIESAKEKVRSAQRELQELTQGQFTVEKEPEIKMIQIETEQQIKETVQKIQETQQIIIETKLKIQEIQQRQQQELKMKLLQEEQRKKQEEILLKFRCEKVSKPVESQQPQIIDLVEEEDDVENGNEEEKLEQTNQQVEQNNANVETVENSGIELEDCATDKIAIALAEKSTSESKTNNNHNHRHHHVNQSTRMKKRKLSFDESLLSINKIYSKITNMSITGEKQKDDSQKPQKHHNHQHRSHHNHKHCKNKSPLSEERLTHHNNTNNTNNNSNYYSSNNMGNDYNNHNYFGHRRDGARRLIIPSYKIYDKNLDIKLKTMPYVKLQRSGSVENLAKSYDFKGEVH